MMRLKVFKYIFLFYSFGINAQNTISGFVTDKIYNSPIEGVQIINPINGNFLTITNNEGYYYYSTQFDSLELLLIHESYITTRKKISFKDNNDILINVGLYLKSIDLDKDETKIETKSRRKRRESSCSANNSINKHKFSITLEFE